MNNRSSFRWMNSPFLCHEIQILLVKRSFRENAMIAIEQAFNRPSQSEGDVTDLTAGLNRIVQRQKRRSSDLQQSWEETSAGVSPGQHGDCILKLLKFQRCTGPKLGRQRWGRSTCHGCHSTGPRASFSLSLPFARGVRQHLVLQSQKRTSIDSFMQKRGPQFNSEQQRQSHMIFGLRWPYILQKHSNIGDTGVEQWRSRTQAQSTGAILTLTLRMIETRLAKFFTCSISVCWRSRWQTPFKDVV